LTASGCFHKNTDLYQDCIHKCDNNNGLICQSITPGLSDMCAEQSKNCIKNAGSIKACNDAYSLYKKEQEERAREFNNEMDELVNRTNKLKESWDCKKVCFSSRKDCISKTNCHLSCINECDEIQTLCLKECE